MNTGPDIPDLVLLSVFSIDRVKDWICWLSPQGHILYANPQSWNALGYAEEDIAKLTVFDIDPNYTPETWAQHFDGLRTLGSRTFETWHRKKDGSALPVEINANYIQFNGQEYNCAIIRVITERKRAERREQTKNRILELVASNAPLREILNFLAVSVEEDEPAKLCSILLMDESGQRLNNYVSPSLPDTYTSAIEGLQVGPCAGSCGTAAYRGEQVIVEDIQTDPLWADFKTLAARHELASCWSMPIKIDVGKVVGTFAIYHRQTKAPSESDIQQLEYLANLAKIAVERYLVAEELKLSDSVFKNSSEGMLVTDADGRVLAANPAFTRISGYALEEVLGRNAYDICPPERGGKRNEEIAHTLAAKGYWQGELHDVRKNGEEYVRWTSINTIYDQAGQPLRRVMLFSDITEKKKNEELVWFEANYDALTQLPNRRLFKEKLQQEILRVNRVEKKVALLFLDLDRFKEVNDATGHQGGDLLLVEVASRLKRTLRNTDSIARIGGDEFTITLSEIGTPAAAALVASSIVRTLAAPFEIDSQIHYISASIGITLCPDDAQDVDMLIKNADQAMYAAKARGRNQFCFFTDDMQLEANKRSQQTRDLRDAIASQAFEAYFQPIVDLRTGDVAKAEALIRWQHKTLGTISPAEFIPLAEDTGLIHEIGDWIFGQSLEQVRLWRASLHPEFQISVNLSPVQFRGASCFDHWFDLLDQAQLGGKAVCMEITEGVLLEASEATLRNLLRFREAGFQVAIDDFGTGYSSLAYINHLDVDYLKIDKSFIASLTPGSRDFVLVEAIIVMAHKLGLKIVAEGVETEAQRDLLKSIGCDYAQGFLYSRPLPAADFASWVEARQRAA
jgi:diguanylate cyclase (GGDEF)-like protein/PAS domain S-box-containing protein